MSALVQLLTAVLFLYYLASNVIYVFLLAAAIHKSMSHQQRLGSIRLENLSRSAFTPPISLVVPAHNEAGSIVDSVAALLDLDYPHLEIVVVNDGSSDSTLERLAQAYQLLPAHMLYVPEIATAPVKRLYKSLRQPRLMVLDKESGGNKADAVNAGLNVCNSPFVCVVDADSLLERDSLMRIVSGIFSDPGSAVAAGGIVRVLNGCSVVKGRLQSISLPRRPLEILQVIEYLRAFLVGREAWACFNMLPIISGAFGIFRRDLVLRIGGFRTQAIGEDIDLVVRLHRYLREQGMEYHISFVPDPTCWTEVPADLKSLGRQRARWQQGLMDTLLRHRDMLFRRRYGRIGLFLLPYMWVFELAAPVMELLGYFTILFAALAGSLSPLLAFEFLLFGYAFATALSVGGVLLEEITYRRYGNWRDVLRLLVFCFLEHFPYRQLNLLWRLQGLWNHFRRNTSWGELKKTGVPGSLVPASTPQDNAEVAAKG
ncbi:MAG TPA: glycosyltransferase [Terriglobales bacterium]|nr:glycosyltransferase [Terriglobales bacterium]